MSICRTQRCGVCTGCTSKACGTCTYCKDNPQFGGPGVKKQSCVTRRCIRVLESKLQREASSSRARAGCGLCADCRLPDCGVCVICLDQRFFAGHFLPGALCAKKKCANARPLHQPSSLSGHLSSSSTSSQDAVLVVDGCCPKLNPSSVIEKQACDDQIRLHQNVSTSRKRQSRSSALTVDSSHLSYSKRHQSEQTILNGNAILGHDTATAQRHPLSAFAPPPFAHHSSMHPLTNSTGYVVDGSQREAASMVNNFTSDYQQPRFLRKAITDSCASFYPYFPTAYRPPQPPASNGFCCTGTAATLPIPYFISAQPLQPQQQQQQQGIQQQLFMPKSSSDVSTGSGGSFASALSAFCDFSSPMSHSSQVHSTSAVPTTSDAHCFASMQNHPSSSHLGPYQSSDGPLKSHAEVPLPAYGSLARDTLWKQALSTESFRRHPTFGGAFSPVGAGDYHHHSASMAAAAAGGYIRQSVVVDPVMQPADHQSVVLQQL
uniref:CXXC-type domain-containing protein n=1 Tax=Trichuris muris TaxID=70415 RepID=A0A5S6QTZ6_TRIMR